MRNSRLVLPSGTVGSTESALGSCILVIEFNSAPRETQRLSAMERGIISETEEHSKHMHLGGCAQRGREAGVTRQCLPE